MVFAIIYLVIVMTKKELVINYIKNKIKTKEFPPNKRIRSEVELAGDLKVSVLTVRNAFTELEKENLIERRQGSGTYIKPYKEYVIIIIDKPFFKEGEGGHFFFLADELYKYFLDTQWTPIIFDNPKENPPFDTDKVAGVINILQVGCPFIDYAKEKNIPIVEFGEEISPFPKVVCDTIARLRKLVSILEENNYKKVLVFDWINEFYNYGSTIDKYYSNFFRENYLYFYNDSRDLNDAKKIIIRGFEATGLDVDAIVFTTTFHIGKSIFNAYRDRIKDHPIIAFTNGSLEFDNDFNYIELKFDYAKIAKALFELALDNINQKWTNTKDIIIQPEVAYYNKS